MNNSLYRYRGCALPNVYLQNGYEIIQSPYGEGVTVHDIDGLHAAIAAAVVTNSAPLTGPEFRFLRQELELSQAMLGGLLGKNEQSVARWEKGKTNVDPVADRFLRVLYQQSKTGSKELSSVLEFLQKLESTPPTPKGLVAMEEDSEWQALSSAACA